MTQLDIKYMTEELQELGFTPTKSNQSGDQSGVRLEMVKTIKGYTELMVIQVKGNSAVVVRPSGKSKEYRGNEDQLIDKVKIILATWEH